MMHGGNLLAPSRILGHATQPGVAVTAIYDRYDRLPEMREALELYEKHLAAIIARS